MSIKCNKALNDQRINEKRRKGGRKVNSGAKKCMIDRKNKGKTQ